MSLRLRLGWWVGVATVVVAGLLAVAFGWLLPVHAARAVVVVPGQAHPVPAAWPVHVAGVAMPGTSGTAVCTATGVAGQRLLEVGARPSRWKPLGAGRVLPAGAKSITCDQPVAVSTGPLVHLYPATSNQVIAAYLTVAAAGAVVAGRYRQGAYRGRRPLLLLVVAVAGTAATVATAVVVPDQRLTNLLTDLLLAAVVVPAAIGASLRPRHRGPNSMSTPFPTH